MAFDTGHALLIGVGSYQAEPRLDVPITVADAEAVSAILRDPQSCGYPAGQVTLLHDETATRAHVLAALDALVDRAGPSDTVLAFYAGHGWYSADHAYYLTTHDTRLDSDYIVPGTALSQQELLEKVRALRARRVVLLFNACHAGELAPTLDVGAPPVLGESLPAPTAAALLATGEGRVILTACRERQTSYIGHGALSIFTQALVNGLRGEGVTSRGGYISIFDLYTHVYFTVGESVARLLSEPTPGPARPSATQEPELTVLKGVGPFPVALHRGATSLGTFRAPEAPAEGTQVRDLDPNYASAMLQQLTYVGGDQVGRDKIGGDQVGHDQVGHDQVGGDQVGRDKVDGDNIHVGNISGSRGIAIGRNARAVVRGRHIAADVSLDPQVLRATLTELYAALGQARLPISTMIGTQMAVVRALDGVQNQEVHPETVLPNLEQVGQILQEAKVTIDEGTSLWESVQKLAPLLGPLVGDARVIPGWFGVMMP